MTVSETELRRALSILDQYRAQCDALQRQQELLTLSLEELVRARETMSRSQQAGKGAPILVPIGGDTVLFGADADEERAILGLGGALLVQEPGPAAGGAL